MKLRLRKPRAEDGFSLIEVLVSVVVISIGLLGVAKMHALAIGNTRNSASRSLAAIYAGSLTSAMHANPGYWQSSLVSTSVTTTPNADRSAILLSDSSLNALTDGCTWSSSNTAPAVCTPQRMAASDLRAWGMSLLQLPGGNGTVECAYSATAPVSCRVTVEWDEKYIAGTESTKAATAKDNADAVANQRSLVILVQP